MTVAWKAIVVCALGYFIDVFDIQLLPILRVASLSELGVSPERLPIVAGYILNVQMLGMMLGAFAWGFIGDRFGRLKALYGSILIYSAGTFACGLIHNTVMYGVSRFVTGFGLAGETGAAITLVAELLPSQKRNWGIVLMAGFGFLGPVCAVLISYFMNWRNTYMAAGIIGLVLLFLRMSLAEPELFKKITSTQPDRGSLKLLLHRRQLITLACCIMIGLPMAFLWNLLNFFSKELGQAVLSDNQDFDQKICLILFYLGITVGDLLSGVFSYIWHSRLKAMTGIYAIGCITTALYLVVGPQEKFTNTFLYTIYFCLGVGGGGWILFSTIAAEHFGTDIRATTSLLTVNFVRGFAIPMVLAFQWITTVTGIIDAALLIGFVLYLTGFCGLKRLRETYDLDLDYVE